MQKLFSKILTIMFLLAFILQLAGLIFLLAVPAPSQAEEKKVYFVPQVGIGDDFQKGTQKTVGDSTAMIGEYINAIYKYAIGIVGILAAVVLMFGGVLWITAGGNAERIGNAKSRIGAALTGLVLTLASYTILYTVNPDLVNFKITTIGDVKDNSQESGAQGCTNSQHLDYETQEHMFSCGNIQLETCTCVSGEGEDKCSEKGAIKNCKSSNYECGVSSYSTSSNWDCETKQCCIQCCSGECKAEGPIMSIYNIKCK